MINLLQQSNLCNNHYRTSKCGYRKALLLQFRIVILQLLYGIVASILQSLGFVYGTIGPSTNFLQYLVVLSHIVHPYHRRRTAIALVIFGLSHRSH